MFRVAFALVCWVCISRHTVEGLQRNGDNVCPKQKLVRVDVVYPELNGWNCTRHYPNITCERIRSGHIDVQSLHFLEESLTCCPGWSRSAEDGEDANSCMMPCEDGYYGENCELECQCLIFNSQPGCNRFDGTCHCSDGWTGHDCDQSCPPMTYGPDCTLNSSYSCANGGTNNPSRDDCLCSSSEYGGTTCEYACSNTSVPVPDCGAVRCEQCAAGSQCDVSRNACNCKYGWWGRYCTERCPPGSRGRKCEDDCCSKNGRCYEEDEKLKCSCKDGFFGEACEEACHVGRYGRGCKQECQCPSCDHVTGKCETCPAGFKGPMCLARCSPSEWGPSCSSRCFCPDNVACDVFTGLCTSTESALVLSRLLILVCSGVVFLVAVVGFVWYRRRSKADGNQESEDVPNDIDGSGYHTVGSLHHYESKIAQPIGSISSAIDASNAIPRNGPNGTMAHNPTYDMEKIESNRRKGGLSADREQSNRSHVYETPTEVETTGGSSTSVSLISGSTVVFVRHDTN